MSIAVYACVGILAALAIAHAVRWSVARYAEFVVMRNVVQQILANDAAQQQQAAEASAKKAKK